MPIKAVSPGLFRAVRAELASGRYFDAGHSDRGDHVVVIGKAAPGRLNLARIDQLPAIYIGEKLYTVIGIIESVARQPELISSVIIPEGTARNEFRLAGPTLVEVETRIGATALIAGQIPLALSPNDPQRVTVAAPPEPKLVKDGVQNDLDSLFLILGGVSLLVGAIGIALTRQWTAVIDPTIPILAPLLGALVGLIAGLYPSLRAARLEPVDALRSGT